MGTPMGLSQASPREGSQPWSHSPLPQARTAVLGRLGLIQKRVPTTHFSFTVSSLKMCTVSVLLEADRNMPSMLKASEQMLTHLRTEQRPRRRQGRPATSPPWAHAKSLHFLKRTMLGR